MDDSHINNPPEFIQTNEICSICLDEKSNNQIFKIDECAHRYCLSCIEKHARIKLLQGIIPKCPHENCDTILKIESCQVFLSSNLMEYMRLLIKELSIPIIDRVYCPFDDCLELMSKSECLENVDFEKQRRCVKCKDLFCNDCEVPWHDGMICSEYKRNLDFFLGQEKKMKILRNIKFSWGRDMDLDLELEYEVEDVEEEQEAEEYDEDFPKSEMESDVTY